MNIRDVKDNIKQFFRGRSSEESERLIDDWYHFYDDKPEELHSFNSVQKEELRDGIWGNIRKSAGITDHGPRWGRIGHRRTERTWPYKMAAGFIVIFFALLTVFLFAPQAEYDGVVEYQTSSNPTGTSSRLTLTDGSTVWLSANSTLRYPANFVNTMETREVILEGEAFFDVVPDPDKPFIVHSENLRTKVLGTSFNIRAFEDEQDIKITVATGKVAVGQANLQENNVAAEDDAYGLLEPDEQRVCYRATRQADTRRVHSRLYRGWKDGELRVEKQTIAEIAGHLESGYGVKIHFEDRDVKESRFRISFRNSSLEHVLNMVQAIEEFEYEIEKAEKQVWIR